MRAKGAIALVPLLAACAVTVGCSSGGARQAAQLSSALDCGRVVDTDASGYLGGPITASRAIAMLTKVRQAGGATRIRKGTLSHADLSTMDIVALDLLGYAGGRLSADATAFARAELSYSPTGYAVNTAYARPLEGGIAALERDCP